MELANTDESRFSKDFTKSLDKFSGKIHHSIVEAIDVIEYLKSRSEAYDKKNMERLRKRDV